MLGELVLRVWRWPKVLAVVEWGDHGSEWVCERRGRWGGKNAVAGSYWAWLLAGGCSGVRGRLVSAVWVAEWTEVVSQRQRWPLQLSAR